MPIFSPRTSTQCRTSAHDKPPARRHRSPQPRKHLLHERGPASRKQYATPHPLLPARRSTLRTEQHQPPGHKRHGGEAIRRTVQGVVGRVDQERGAPQTKVLRDETRTPSGGRGATRLTGKQGRKTPRPVTHRCVYQELLAWLLDALHEDLNRVARKQYTELKDSGGRPDEVVADEAWLQHLARDHSIITDLFYGQLKSKVTCQTCGHESVRFDPFNLLSLPLPMESYTLCEVLGKCRWSGLVPFLRTGYCFFRQSRKVSKMASN